MANKIKYCTYFLLNFIISAVLLLSLVQFFIPGNLVDILESDGYSISLTGEEALASAFNVIDTQINGQNLITTGIDSQFCVDISNYKPFKFVRIHVSGLIESQKAQVFWAHPNEAMSEQASSGIFSLKNGINLVKIPNDGLTVLRFDLATDPNVSITLESVEFTNNFYISPIILITIFIISMFWSLSRIGLLALLCNYIKKTKFAELMLVFFTNIEHKILQNKGILIFILLCFGNYSLWTIVTPFNGSPDEYMRWDIVDFIVNHGTLPRGDDPEIINPIWGFSYAFLPYTTQIIGAYFVKLVSLFNPSQLITLYAARFPSVLCSLGTVWFTWLIGNKLFDKKLAWFLTVFVALFPENMMIASYINNDSFALFTTSIIIYAWIIGIDNKFDYKSTIILAIGIGLCSISYYNAFGFILLSIAVWLHVIFTNNNLNKIDWIRISKNLGTIFAIVLVIAGWWYIRQVIIYDGDIFGLKSVRECGELLAPDNMKPSNRQTFLNEGKSIFFMLANTNWISSTMRSFIAQFGYMNISAPLWVYWFYGLLFAICATGLALRIYRILLKGEKASTFSRRPAFWTYISFSIPIPILLSIYSSYTSDFQPQGRYILPMLVSLSILCTLGISRQKVLSSRITLILFESGIIISNAACFIKVFSTFYLK